ncbi:DUF2711 family protein [Kiloniella laminariae]|uniref:DUF2711 family protein n=1 Tax=Kiloniella laminariae TaxID=454162 RepID=A0ABT4LLG5_9PROT|nr:DUF2711 family protein [Kiloniella laminariae]MCZ4281964.1 DUF2711 family protein [Kiloniella laminariae]
MDRDFVPAPELYASCPVGGKVLEYYRGQFEAVFILLHPFMRPRTISPDLFYPDTWPKKKEIIADCEPCSWNEVLCACGLKSLSEVDTGLRTLIGALNPERSNSVYAEVIENYCDQNNLIPPEPGDLSVIIENLVFETLMKKLGYRWLWVGDEFGLERKLHKIEDVIKADEIIAPPHARYFTHDHQFLIATHWDSHCTFLCSSRERLETFLQNEKFEGFFCTENTEVYWGLYPL